MTIRRPSTETGRLAGLGIAFSAGLLAGHLTGSHRTAELRARLERTEHRADHDALTGLLNRDGARRRLENQATAGSVVLIDLDGFKQVNDAHGHPVGDAVLAETGRRLHREADRIGGLAARLGGDEFLLVLPPGLDSVVEVVESILDTLTRPIPVPLAHTAVTVLPGLSAGLTPAAGHTGRAGAGQTWTETLRRADVALYHAKHDPRRRLVVHTPGLRHPGTDAPGERLRDLATNDPAVSPTLP